MTLHLYSTPSVRRGSKTIEQVSVRKGRDRTATYLKVVAVELTVLVIVLTVMFVVVLWSWSMSSSTDPPLLPHPSRRHRQVGIYGEYKFTARYAGMPVVRLVNVLGISKRLVRGGGDDDCNQR
ncbi:hypothetical protein BDZ89DRAFT_1033367 [Hymenopellis radicata]|nr:hypothetical protein BDZ89DRAFT_1033367 [Hymenopellis radicata]